MSYEVWGYLKQTKTIVTRYNLAYINHSIFNGDNGRVLGFDNAHGFHHRHYMGKIEEVDFVSYEATQERFQQEWLEIINTRKEIMTKIVIRTDDMEGFFSRAKDAARRADQGSAFEGKVTLSFEDPQTMFTVLSAGRRRLMLEVLHEPRTINELTQRLH